jgi:predicted Zn-dependent peptidase
MLHTFTLSNGIKVATYNLPSLKSFYLRVLTKGGSLVENKTNNGAAHFMEHMLVQGIPMLPNVEEFSSYIESLAGSYSAHTSRLQVGFDINIPARCAKEAVQIASEVFFAPLFVESALEKERQAIAEELATNQDSHWYKISEFFRATRFAPDHSLTLDPGGTVDIVKSLTRDDLVKFWSKYFVPENTYIIISGSFDLVELKGLLEQYFGHYQNTRHFPGFPDMSDQDFSDRNIFVRSDHKLSVNYIDLTFPSLKLEDDWKDRMRQNLALIILGGIRNSRLFKLLRYQKGLIYDVSSGGSVMPGIGYGYINSEVSTEHLSQVVELTAKELATFVRNGPTDEELQFVKHYVSNQWLMAFDHPSSIASWIENGLLWNENILLPEEYISVIDTITATEIRDLIQNRWNFNKLNLTIQGPIKDGKHNHEKFEELISVLH